VKILFTHSYFYRFDPKQWRNQQPYPPYGTLCAAALMRECGADVHLFDVALRHSPAEIEPVLAAERPDYLVIYDDGFNYLTKMCLTKMREAAFEMCRLGRAAGCTVLVNSSDSTDHYEDYLQAGAHFVIHGEGELTLRELVFELEKGAAAEPEKVFGISGMRNTADGLRPTADGDFVDVHLSTLSRPPSAVFRPPSEVFKTPPRPVATDLDALPDPAWDLVQMADYQAIWQRSSGYLSLNIATTRGCPYKCNWCAKPIYGNRYNARSPQRVAAEIERLYQQFGVRHFWMSDDIFGLKPGWVQQFRDEVRARNLPIQYKIQSRVDLLLKEDTIDALVESGLRQVWVGAESGSQRILDAMDKGTQVEEIRDATRLLQKKGVEFCFFLQFGYLGETLEDIELTLKMVDDLRPHDIGVSVSYPLPGTKFYEKVRDLLGAKQNWTDSDDLAMMYPATFSPEFYRRLHRVVHHRFRRKQGLAAWQNLLSGQRPDWRQVFQLPYRAVAAAAQWQACKTQMGKTAD
jgi:radical SAM superfamily enzyme YgiQ (UPF0313 family)